MAIPIISPDPTIYLGDTSQSTDSLKRNASNHRDLRDGLNKLFGNDPMSRPEAIDWQQRYNEGLIDNGVVKVTAGDAFIGRSQPELQLAYETWRQKALQRQAIALNADREAEGLQRVVIDTDTNAATLNKSAAQLNSFIRDRDILLKMDGGPAAFALLGENPTNTQVMGAISERTNELAKPQKERDEELFNDSLLTNKSTREAATKQFDLNKQTAAENQNFRQWQAKDQSAYRQFQEAEATRRLQYDNANRVSDRNLQMQLAEMNRDERRDARRDDRLRESKRDRQAYILQLMRGLSDGIGKTMGGY